jgi:VWFA-related protein
MPRYACVLVLFAFASAGVAQSAPSPSIDSARQLSKVASPGPVATIQANTQLVVVDVVVTDSAHRPVHGLKAADFALMENGAPQRLRSFEEHSTLAAPPAPQPPLPPGVFTNQPQVPPGGAVTILLLDSLNTPTSDQAYLHQQLMAYLKSAAPGSRTAIFGLSDHLLLLQGFDADPAVLRKAMEKINSKASTVRSDVAGNGIQESAADFLEDSQDPMFAELVANLRQWDAQQQSLELQMRAKYTIDAFNQLARALAAIPGRKNLLWFSASFPLNVMPDTIDNLGSNPSTPANDNFLNPFAGQADMSGEFQAAITRLSRSQVAVYPIDVRGVTQSAVFAADTTRNYGGGARGAARLSADQSKFISDTAAENSTMTSLAKATGGRAYISTNDLTGAVKESVDQGSNFYSVSYSPTDSNMDGKLRSIKVRVAHPGVTLAYRTAYYAVPPDAVKTSGFITQTAGSAGANDLGATALRTNLRLAMARGAPAPTDILFRVGVVPMTDVDKPEETVAPNNTAAAKAKGPWRRYSVNYQIDPAGLVFFRGADGNIHADFDLMVFVYTSEGVLVDVTHNVRGFTGGDGQVRTFYQNGIVQHAEVSAPAKGEYFLRIAVHDLHRDHYGAVEIATPQVKNVAAVEVPTHAAAAPPSAAK